MVFMDRNSDLGFFFQLWIWNFFKSYGLTVLVFVVNDQFMVHGFWSMGSGIRIKLL